MHITPLTLVAIGAGSFMLWDMVRTGRRHRTGVAGSTRSSGTTAAEPVAAPPQPPRLYEGKLWLKRYGSGKCSICVRPEEEHAAAVEQALSVAMDARITFDRVRFLSTLESAGVPDTVAQRYLTTLEINDELYLLPDWPR